MMGVRTKKKYKNSNTRNFCISTSIPNNTQQIILITRRYARRYANTTQPLIDHEKQVAHTYFSGEREIVNNLSLRDHLVTHVSKATDIELNPKLLSHHVKSGNLRLKGNSKIHKKKF